MDHDHFRGHVVCPPLQALSSQAEYMAAHDHRDPCGTEMSLLQAKVEVDIVNMQIDHEAELQKSEILFVRDMVARLEADYWCLENTFEEHRLKDQSGYNLFIRAFKEEMCGRLAALVHNQVVLEERRASLLAGVAMRKAAVFEERRSVRTGMPGVWRI